MIKAFFIKHPKKIAVAIFFVIIAIVWISLTNTSRQKPLPALTVAATKVQIKTMPLEISAVGTVEAAQSVAIIPQVTGVIQQIAIKPGQTVQQGQLLFKIDASTYEANLAQAQAVLARDQAQLAANQADVKRYAALVKLEYVTQQQYDQAKATAQAQAAVVAADEAAVAQAQIQLGYTQIHSPITGKAGDISIKLGDLATAYATTPLVTINQLDPLWVSFAIPQNKLPLLLKYLQPKTPLTVEIYTQHQKHLLGKAQLFFVDNTVNTTSGTMLLKAKLDNASGTVAWPGVMVQVKLILTQQNNAIVIPVTAIQQDQKGSFVYLIVNGKAVVQPITVDRYVGEEAVITQGLAGTEEVITAIPPDLNEGTPVQTAVNGKESS